MNALDRLLEVQDRDIALDRLRVRRENLAERAELATLEEKIAMIAAKQADVDGRRQELVSHQSELEAEATGSTERIHQIERRMYSGEVSASRELQAMADEVEALKRRRSMLEDRIVEVMESLEPLDVQSSKLRTERSGIDSQADEVRGALSTSEAAIDAEAGAESEARSTLAAELPVGLAATYERLRARLGGVGAARLVNGSCGGCHLALPSAELEQVLRAAPDAVVNCEQCGRILVR